MGVLPDWLIREKVKIEPFAEGEKRPGKISIGLSHYGYDLRLGPKFRIFSPIGAREIDPKAFDPKACVEVDRTPHRHAWNLVGDHIQDWMCERCKKVSVERELSVQNQTEQCGETPPDHVHIPPYSFALAETVEWLEIPRDCLAVILGKSSYARCGLIVNCTPLEPEWKGKVTIELSNTTPLPMKLYVGEGIAQVYFLQSAGIFHRFFTWLVEFLGFTTGMTSPAYRQEMAAESDKLELALRNGSCQVSYADKGGKYSDQKGLELPKVD